MCTCYLQGLHKPTCTCNALTLRDRCCGGFQRWLARLQGAICQCLERVLYATHPSSGALLSRFCPGYRPVRLHAPSTSKASLPASGLLANVALSSSPLMPVISQASTLPRGGARSERVGGFSIIYIYVCADAVGKTLASRQPNQKTLSCPPAPLKPSYQWSSHRLHRSEHP